MVLPIKKFSATSVLELNKTNHKKKKKQQEGRKREYIHFLLSCWFSEVALKRLLLKEKVELQDFQQGH